MSDLNWTLLTLWLIPITILLGKLAALALDEIGNGVYVSPFPSEYETFYSDKNMCDKIFKLSEAAYDNVVKVTVNGFIDESDARIFSDSLFKLSEFLYYRNKPVPKYLVKRIRLLIKARDCFFAHTKKAEDDSQGMSTAVDGEPADKEI
jgi:hypothetical protein